ncbi:cytochrome c [Bordetella ansorpii]|uniref:Cytochrome c n=1 Tax=Bordetella ansorpii TaxID=288768 RepID=A0A157NLA0_9BORD|nr:c-type cytochrome [Bordetella ansorpii]SAI22085.1 cytochrome c [Bordetella ansorpii]
MSNEHQAEHQEHASPIKTPKQLAVTIALSFIIPIAVILLLVNYVTSADKVGAGSDTMTPKAVEKRIMPVAGFELVDANAPKVFKTGEQVFQSTCTACHTSGAAGAPKLGDKTAWAPFIKTGFDEMLKVAIHGKGAMPAKGGNPGLDDFEIARAVAYMANKSGGDFPEPKEPEKKAEKTADAAPTPAPAAAAPAAPAPQQAQAPAPQQQAPAPAPQPEQQAAVNPAGEKLYKTTCFACHGTGVANAPKLGDKAAWAPYIATGLDTMVKVATQGKGAMPPKGGAMNASDADFRAAVEYMVNASK